MSLKERYRLGKVGDVEVKQKFAQALNNFLIPLENDERSSKVILLWLTIS